LQREIEKAEKTAAEDCNSTAESNYYSGLADGFRLSLAMIPSSDKTSDILSDKGVSLESNKKPGAKR
jgi:hypothetical protein